MLPQLEPVFVRSFEMIRELAALSLSGSQALLCSQIDQAQALMTRNGERLREALANVPATPEQWSEAMQATMRDAVDSTRECMLAATAMQAETMRLVEKQAAEAQAILTEALEDAQTEAQSGGFTVAINKAAAAAPSRRNTRTREVEHRRAA